jgi:hypothetical protein
MDLSQIKDGARNIWTQVGLLDALVLTIILAMLQEDPIEPHFDMDDRDALELLQEFYISFCLVAVMSVLLSIMKCIANLTFVEPLAHKDVIKYCIANPSSIGEPVCDLCISCVFAGFAIAIWVLGSYGASNGAFAFLIMTYVTGYSFGYCKGKSVFDPSPDGGKEWQWTVKDPSEWPSWVKSKDERTVRVFKRLGAAAGWLGSPTQCQVTFAFSLVRPHCPQRTLHQE